MSKTYLILVGRNIFALEQEVNKFIHNGYTPVGGIAVMQGEYCQAVMRNKESEDKDMLL